MGDYHEIVKFSDNSIAWVYSFSENHINVVPRHWHLNLEITYICKGSAKYTVNGIKLNPRQGDILIINCGDIHEGIIPYGECEAINIMIPFAYLRKFSSSSDTVMFKLDESKSEHPKLVELLELLYDVFSARKSDNYSQLRINGLVLNIIYLLFSSFRWDGAPQKPKKQYSRHLEIIEYIEQNFQDDISMDVLTKHFALSKEHISRIFRENNNTTFLKYLTKVRMIYAHKQLINTNLSITQIALDSGFSDSRAFIFSFKKSYGTTPGQYRKAFEAKVEIDQDKEV